jgi:alpha-ketoglutarate-dependent taurine dioxygenase
MKISKIPGFGDYGHYIDDINFDHLSHEEWMQIGRLHLKGLVTILRNVTITKDQYYSWIPEFGPVKSNTRASFVKKYGNFMDANKIDPDAIDDEEDRLYLSQKKYLLEKTDGGNYLNRVTGKKDKDGNPLGVFSSGEVRWHSNESGILTFSPGVALLGGEFMKGSSTGFTQTANVYESFSNSFRSELDEMIIIHKYLKGKVNDEELIDPRYASNVQKGFCPIEDSEVPMVLISPGGIRGLHYTINSAVGIRGMSESESTKIFKILDQAIFTSDNIFDHWYQNDNDLLLFDNSITLHRRLGGHPDRLAYRIQFDYSNLLDSAWYPYIQPEFQKKYHDQIHEIVNLLNLNNFKLPT